MTTIAYSFDARFASVPLRVTSFSAPHGRRVQLYQPSRGDGAESFDRGRVPRVDSIEAVLLGTASTVAEGRRRLLALAESGEARTFVHPLDGEWSARLQDLDERVAAGSVAVSMSLLRVDDFERAPRNTGNPLEDTTADDVEVDAERADQLLATAGVDAPSVAELMAPIQEWDEMTPLSDRSNRIEGIKSALQSTKDLLFRSSGVAAYQAGLQLTRAIASAQFYSDTLRANGLQFGEIRLTRDVNLGSLLAELYGAAATREIFEQVVSNNSLRSVTRVRADTVLQLPTRESVLSLGL